MRQTRKGKKSGTEAHQSDAQAKFSMPESSDLVLKLASLLARPL